MALDKRSLPAVYYCSARCSECREHTADLLDAWFRTPYTDRLVDDAVHEKTRSSATASTLNDRDGSKAELPRRVNSGR